MNLYTPAQILPVQKDAKFIYSTGTSISRSDYCHLLICYKNKPEIWHLLMDEGVIGMGLTHDLSNIFPRPGWLNGQPPYNSIIIHKLLIVIFIILYLCYSFITYPTCAWVFSGPLSIFSKKLMSNAASP